MRVKTKFYEAVANLLGAKLRSFLALLGILVGTASVVAMVSGGNLATRAALQQLTRLGTNLLALSLYSQSNQQGGTPQSISYRAVSQMKNKIEQLKEVGPYTQVYSQISYMGHKLQGETIGVTQSLKGIVALNLQEGRFISPLDRYSMKCVVGQKLYQQIRRFSQAPLLNQQIRIGKQYCTVVGVASTWLANSFVYTDLNNAVMVPLRASLLISKYATINNIIFRLQHHANIDELKNQIIHFVNQYANGMRTFFMSPKQLIASARKQSDILTLFLAFIAGISLLVGGIGVMNIMLVSVVERKKEIGIRKAVGAKQKDIISLFLIESVLLSLTGGVIGVVLGVVVTYFISIYKHWQFTIFPLPIILGFTVSVLCGIFFGLYPAYKAAKLDPIEALRSL